MAGQNGNGNGTIGFPGARVPIVGQPFDVTGLLVTALLVCKCSGAVPLMVASNGPTQCPKCRKAYVVNGVQWKQGQPPNIQIAILAPEPSGDTAPAILDSK